MKKHQTAKRLADDDTDSEDDPASSGEQAKIALRRAKNREAARRVRERRVTAIKTLSEQVETLVEENKQLREQIQQLEAGQGRSPRSAAMSGSSGGIKTVSDEIAPSGCSVSVKDASTQTDPLPPADVPPTPAGPTSSSAREGWNSSIMQSPASHSLQPQQLQQLGSSPLLTPAAPASSQQHQQQQLLNLQQMQMMLQLQMQMLQVQSGGSYPATSLPAGLHMSGILQTSGASSQQQQYEKSSALAAATVPLGSMAWAANAGAAVAAVSSAVPASSSLQSPSRGVALQGISGAFNAAQQRLNISIKQEPTASAAQQQQLLAQLQQQQQQQQAPPLQRQQQQPKQGQSPRLQLQQLTQVQSQQQQQLQHAGQQNQQQSSASASGQEYRQSLQYQQRPGQQQLHAQLLQAHPMSLNASAGTANTAAGSNPQAGAAAATAAAGADSGAHPSFKPLAGTLLDDDGMLMSADINLNTAEMNIINTADMNITSSDFNAMLASEEILRHVPLPEDATASHSTAWL